MMKMMQLLKWIRCRAVEICAAGAGVLALLSWLSWLSHDWRIAAFGTDYVPMAPSTAWALMLLSCGVFLNRFHPAQPIAQRFAFFAVLGVGTMSVLIEVQYFLGIELPLEQWLASSSPPVGSFPTGRMSPLTAAAFLGVVFGFFLELPPLGSRWICRQIASVLSLAVLLIGLLVVVSYAIGMPVLYHSRTIPMALPTAISFVMLGLSILIAAGIETVPFSLFATGSPATCSSASRWSILGIATVFLLLAAAFGMIGYQYFQYQIAAARQAAQNELTAIADLKVRQIVDWRKERLSNARIIMREPFFRQAVQRSFADPNDGALRASLATWLKTVGQHNQSLRALLLDHDLKVRLAWPAEKAYFGPIAAQYSEEALQLNRIITSDLHRSRFSGEIHFDLAVPLETPLATAESVSEKLVGVQKRSFGVLLLEVDPSEFLYPLIQDWPTPSRTSETMMLRREGNEIVYLNELRHRKHTALSFRSPMDEDQHLLTATIAASRREGIIEGTDYRHTPVLAVSRRIPETPWYILAKVDQAEIYTPLQERAWVTAIALLTFYLATVFGTLLLWRRRDLAAQKQSAMALQREARRYRAIMDASMDGIYILDSAGNLLECNNAFLRNLGFTREESLHLQVRDWNSQMSREDIFQQFQTIMNRDATFETRHRRKDGSLMDVEINATSMLLDGNLLLCNSVRDISERKRTELALGESDQRFMNVLQASRDAILLLDKENFIDCNEATCRMLGYSSREDFLMLHPAELSPPRQPDGRESFEKAEEMIATAFREGFHRFEWMHQKANGEDFLAEVSLTPITYLGKNILHCLWRDITEFKRAEAALCESEERYRGLFENMTEGYAYCRGIFENGRMRDWNYVAVNPRFEALSGLKDVIGKNVSEVIPGIREADPELFAFYERVATTGKPEKTEIFVEAMQRWFSVSAYSPAKYEFVDVFDDITERKNTEAAILRAKKEWEGTFDVVPDIITILDTNYRIRRANRALAELVGLTPKECVGQECFRLMHGTEAPPGNCPNRTLLYKGSFQHSEVYDQRSDKYYSVTVTPLRDAEDELCGCVHVAHDITDLKNVENELGRHRDHLEELVRARTAEAEEARFLAEESNEQMKFALEQANSLAEDAKQASNAKSRFLASMSHELRTPLNGVLGMIDLLSKTSLDERQRRFAETSRSSAVTLLQLISDILDFSKIEANRLELDRCEFSLPQVVKDAMQLIAPKVYEKDLELVCFVAPECQRIMVGDGSRLQQILVNLMGNAVKFTARGEICLQVTRLAEGPGWIIPKFQVVDTGIGIPADRRNRLFQSFSQVDSSTTRKFGGTGLGLAISKSLVEAMGGEIGVESEVGRGSTFWFTIKIETSDAAPLAEIALPAELRNLHTLVAIGNETLQKAVVEYLESWGLESEAIGTTADALARLEDRSLKPFQLMVIDEENAEWRELATSIRGNSAIRQPLLILMTPFCQHEEGVQYALPAKSRSIVKPICQSILFDAIIDLCSNTKKPSQRPLDASAPGSKVARSRYAGKARILLAEDNRINQMYCLEILRQAGLESECVDNGVEAVEAVMAKPYDAILMDCHMPEMDGYEASWRIVRHEQIDPTRGRTPIIALTANAIKGDREVCLDAGMDEYLSKPFEGRSLIELIDRLLDKRAERQPAIVNDLASLREGEVSAESPAIRQSSAIPAVRQAPRPAESAQADFCEKEDVPPIDFGVLVERCMGNADFAASLLEELESNGPDQMATLAGYLECGAIAEAAKTAHSVKGAAGILGAEPLRAAAAQIEAAGKAGNLERAAALLDEMHSEMRRCLEFLPEIRERLTAMN